MEMGWDVSHNSHETNTFNLNRYSYLLIITKSVTLTKNSYDKVYSVQHAMKPLSDNDYSFDDAVNRIISQCRLKEVLPKK
jgi:hypothetical protein